MSKEDEAPDVLAREITEEGRARAERILQKARAEAEKTLQAARGSAEAAAGKLREDAAARARKRTEMILHAVGQEVARRKLQGRERVIQETLDEAARLLNSATGQEYLETVRRLAVEAMRGMPGESFVLRVSIDEAAAGRIAQEAAAALQGEGRAVEVRAAADAAVVPGVVVESADGRMAWDNTFQARMWRLRDGLRQSFAPVLFEEK